MTFQQSHWYLKDLQYSYLDDGFKLVATTDVTCHLFARMTTTPPRKHALPSMRRGLFLQGDIRFCFVVYKDNEQNEAGDTLIHTWHKSAWPICETRWFYFVGTQGGSPSVSESPIFKFHFPAPPPEPPPPIEKWFFGTNDNNDMHSNDGVWLQCWHGSRLRIPNHSLPPQCYVVSDWVLTATYYCRRSWLYIDTSTLPSTFKMLAGELNVYAWELMQTSSFAWPNFCITRGVQSAPFHFRDWSNQNTETFIIGKIDIRTAILNSYNPIAIDPAYQSFLTPGGITKLCLRMDGDIANVPPPLGRNALVYYTDCKGAGYRPFLHISYYPEP